MTVFEDWVTPETVYDCPYVSFDHMVFFYLHHIDGVSDPLSITNAVAQISPCPLLLIGALGPEERSTEQYFAAAHEPKKLILQNTPHISGLSTHPQECEETMIRFFDTLLLREGG